MESSFEFLRFVQSKDLSFWDVKTYSCKSVCSQFVVIKLKDYLTEQNKKEKLFKYPNKYFKILGVNNQNGLFDAYEEQGKNINQPYKKVEDGWFAYNPYRVNVGSIGLKSAQQNNEYISPAYVVFSCKDALLPDYLNVIIKTKFFNEAIKANTTGSVRQTLGFNNLCNIEIPLPSIERQKELVAQYNALLNLAKDKENQADTMEQSIDDYLMAKLGIKANLPSTNNSLFQTVEYKNLDKWGKIVNSQNFGTFFDVIPFADIVTEGPFYGANVKGSNINNGCRYVRITDIKDDGSLNNDIVYPEVVDNRYLLQENDFLIARSGATVGKTFLYKTSYGKCIFAGYLVRYRINSNVNPMYLLYYTQVSPYKKWVKITQRVAAQPNINGQEYLKFPFVFPPLDIQNQIVEEITLRKKQIKNLREESEKLRSQALSDFEKEVFN